MKDPYQILGVPETATDEEVKKAYLKLARKYHPDNYHDNPLADLAQEKMKEINAAYEQITKSRSGGQRSGYNAGYGGYSDRGSWNSQSSSGSSVSFKSKPAAVFPVDSPMKAEIPDTLLADESIWLSIGFNSMNTIMPISNKKITNKLIITAIRGPLLFFFFALLSGT